MTEQSKNSPKEPEQYGTRDRRLLESFRNGGPLGGSSVLIITKVRGRRKKADEQAKQDSEPRPKRPTQ